MSKFLDTDGAGVEAQAANYAETKGKARNAPATEANKNKLKNEEKEY